MVSEYYELLDIESFFFNDFHDNLSLVIFLHFEGRTYTSVQDLIAIIKKNNSSVIIPNKCSWLLEKNVALEWISYNTPTFKDPTITPLLGTMFPGVDLSDNSPSSIYQQWLISLYMLTWEFIILDKAKIYLECNTDLSKDILDISRLRRSQPPAAPGSDENTIYWLNRQLRIQDIESFLNRQDSYIVDYYSNKYAFYREIYEDITYVLLNIILAKKIVDSFMIDDSESLNSDIFFIKLTEILREHYIDYSKEYKNLNSLWWYRINHYSSTTQVLDTYKALIKSGKNSTAT